MNISPGMMGLTIAGYEAYVPGFWSWKGLNSTVLTSMVKLYLEYLVGLRGELRRSWESKVVEDAKGEVAFGVTRQGEYDARA
jgi:hypothetical protein